MKPEVAVGHISSLSIFSAYKLYSYMSHIFTVTLFVLTYRLLFHTERHLTLVSFIFCISCAFCVQQLSEGLFTPGVDYGTGGLLHLLDGPRQFIASCARPFCFYSGLREEARETCARLIALVQVNGSYSSSESQEPH